MANTKEALYIHAKKKLDDRREKCAHHVSSLETRVPTHQTPRPRTDDMSKIHQQKNLRVSKVTKHARLSNHKRCHGNDEVSTNDSLWLRHLMIGHKP